MPRWESKADPAAIAPRLRALLGKRAALTEKAMFGGVCFLLRGNMLCGAGKPGFMFRIDPARDDEAAGMQGAEPMIQGGRRMRGFFWVDAKACDQAALRRWLSLAESYVVKMPAKAKKK